MGQQQWRPKRCYSRQRPTRLRKLHGAERLGQEEEREWPAQRGQPPLGIVHRSHQLVLAGHDVLPALEGVHVGAAALALVDDLQRAGAAGKQR